MQADRVKTLEGTQRVYHCLTCGEDATDLERHCRDMHGGKSIEIVTCEGESQCMIDILLYRNGLIKCHCKQEMLLCQFLTVHLPACREAKVLYRFMKQIPSYRFYQPVTCIREPICMRSMRALARRRMGKRDTAQFTDSEYQSESESEDAEESQEFREIQGHDHGADE